MSRATFGPKVLLTFLIWMIDIVCYLFICCLRVAAAWQLLLLPLGLAALAWHGCCFGLAAWLGMAAAWLGCFGLAAWLGLAALSFAGRTTYKYTKILQKPSEDMRLLASSPHTNSGRHQLASSPSRLFSQHAPAGSCPPEPSRFARQACACRKTSQPQSALLTAPFRGTRPSRCCGRWLRCFGFLRKPR